MMQVWIKGAEYEEMLNAAFINWPLHYRKPKYDLDNPVTVTGCSKDNQVVYIEQGEHTGWIPIKFISLEFIDNVIGT